MTDNNDLLKYLQAAKEFTNSTNIDVLIDTARKIEDYIFQKNCDVVLPFDEFIKKIRIPHPTKGMIPFRLFQFQQEVVQKTNDNDKVVICTAGQMGMTTMICAYVLWQASHFPNKNIILISPKFNQAIDMINRIKMMMEYGICLVPFITSYTKNEIEFNNGSKISVGTPTSKIRGHNYTDLYIQDAAYISFSQENDFWNEIFPCITQAKCIIHSTPNKKEGLFYNTYNNASTNGFVDMKIPWHLHPDRDEKWAENMKQIMGENRFKIEHEAEFVA